MYTKTKDGPRCLFLIAISFLLQVCIVCQSILDVTTRMTKTAIVFLSSLQSTKGGEGGRRHSKEEIGSL